MAKRNLMMDGLGRLERKEGKSYFRFENGKSFKSKEFLLMPVYFGGHRAMMGIDVVEARIPLLISLATMKKANTVIRTATDTAIICGKKIKLVRLGGHYTISLRKGEAEVETENFTDEEENGITPKSQHAEYKRTIKKLFFLGVLKRVHESLH